MLSNNSLVDYALVLRNLRVKRVGRLLYFIQYVNLIQSVLPSVLLRKDANNCQKIDDIVELCFREFSNSPYKYLEWGIRPLQVKEELIELLKIVQIQKPKVLLEIGTAGGGTLFSFMKTIPKDIINAVNVEPINNFKNSDLIGKI